MSKLPPRLLLFILAITCLAALIQFGLVNIALDRLELSTESAYLLLMCTLARSLTYRFSTIAVEKPVDKERPCRP